MSEKNKELVKQIDKSFEDADSEAFFELCAGNIEWTMVGEKTRKGIEEIREWMSSMQGSEPPKITARKLVAEGETVAAQGEMTMKNESGEIVPYTYCDIYRFEDGKIAELTSFVIKTEH